MAEVIEALQSVRFAIGQDGKATDVIVSIETWEKLIAWLEDLEDSQVVKSGLTRLKAAQGDPQKAGLIPWADVEAELDELDDIEAESHVSVIS